MEYQGFTLDRFQEEAIRWIEKEQSVIVSAPTGSGKTIVAEYAIDRALEKGKGIIYTAPIKALSNQKFRDFTRRYGNKVGIMTGDVTFHADAPIMIMTTEIFRNALFEDVQRFNNISYLILDEIHYLDDAERGSVWEESIIFAPSHIKILCLSATIPNVKELSAWISKVREEPMQIVYEERRSVPLSEFCCLTNKGIVSREQAMSLLPKKKKEIRQSYHEFVGFDAEALKQILDYVRKHKQIPCLCFVFSRKECEFHAYQYAQVSLLTQEEKTAIINRLNEFTQKYQVHLLQEGLGYLVCRGVAYHHAGMMPAYKEIVEQLFTDGLIKILFATETFALGVNMPASSVVFSSIKKYDGISIRYLNALEYQQMSGRAGRRGLDEQGYVHTNLAEEAITRDELKKILAAKPEAILSRFNLSYSTLLALYQRVGNDVLKTCDKSFGAFQKIMEAQEKGGKQEKKKIAEEQRRLIKKKLSFLKALGYLTSQGITSKGRFAIFINGYEIPLTEIFFQGFLENCNEVSLFILLLALTFESKKGEFYPKVPQEFKKLSQKVEQYISNLKKMEVMFGMEEIKPADFHLSAAAYAWAKGASFQELSKYCSTSAGDIIRSFRLTLQLCRQLRKACQDYKEFVKLIDRSILLINRDEVNALKQLKAFASISNSSESLDSSILSVESSFKP